jgi:hypothetical protein
MAIFETGRTGYEQPTAAPKDTGESFQLERIANALEEVLRLVKEDMERMKKINE